MKRTESGQGGTSKRPKSKASGIAESTRDNVGKKRVYAERIPRRDEIGHLIHFLLAQLRWQHGLLVGTFEEFDAEASKHNRRACDDEESVPLQVGDIKGMEKLMEQFFARHAKGDKWVPFHAVLGAHERYIMERIWSLPHLNTKQKYALSCGFSGSRWPPLYDHAILCFFSSPSTSVSSSATLSDEALLLFENPVAAFRRGGDIHKRFLEYRASGGKLHTTCFSPRPVPAGASGDEYTFYILERTRTFFMMGLQIFDELEVLKGSGGWEAIDAAMQKTKWVGPTISKMLLVSTHFGLPNLHLLDEGIEVGIGAQEAFKLLHPGIQPAKNYDMLPERRDILVALFEHVKSLSAGEVVGKEISSSSVTSFSPSVEPRLQPMIKWCALKAREKYCGSIPPECFETELSILNFQVNLCEWRKFRNNVDKHRQGKRGMGSL